MELKEILYDAIKEYGEQRILSDIAQGASSDTINIIMEYCLPSLKEIKGLEAEVNGTLAEVLLHYMLTVALIPSQRKISLDSTDIDIVVPNTKTLISTPKEAILVVFPKTRDAKVIKEQINRLQKIQPNLENIWIILDEDITVDTRVYLLKQGNHTFANIINDLINFSSNKKESKFKIFRISDS